MNDAAFEALPTMESLTHKENPDENAIYRFELEGISSCIWEIWAIPSPMSSSPCYARAGGPPTIELENLERAIEEIQPPVVIPMHYQIPKLKLDILPLEAFTSRYPEDVVTRVGTTEVEFAVAEGDQVPLVRRALIRR